MDDFYEHNINDSRSLDIPFTTINEDNYYLEERRTSYFTTNALNYGYNYYNYENNAEYLNNFPDNFQSSFKDNECPEDDKVFLYLKKKTNRDDEDKKIENKIATEDKNKNIFMVKKQLSDKENLNKENLNKEKLNNENLNNENLKNNKKLKEEESKKDKQYNFGRKKQESGEKGIHTKIVEDNIINKLKANIFNRYIRNLIKKYSINKDIELKKLRTKEFIADLSKFNNERLFNMKISEILREQPISTKYSTFDEFENKKIIDKIYNENIEKNVIKILELTFEELLIIFRKSLNASEDMKKLEEIKNKIEGLDLLGEKNKCKGIENLIEELKPNHEKEYIEKVKTVCLGYKNWFNKKKERKYN